MADKERRKKKGHRETERTEDEVTEGCGGAEEKKKGKNANKKAGRPDYSRVL